MKIILKGCSDCDLSELDRLPRAFWMRWLPGLRHYHCGQCRRNMLAAKRLVESRKWMMSTVKNLDLAAPRRRPST